MECEIQNILYMQSIPYTILDIALYAFVIVSQIVKKLGSKSFYLGLS